MTAPSLQIAEEIAEFYADPLGFVMFAYPWGEAGGPLADEEGPDAWQREVLEEIGRAVKDRGFDGANAVLAIRHAVASGHGIGKSTLVAWVVHWIMSTRPYCQGTVTANSWPQLDTKTWPAIRKWFKLGINNGWFDVFSAQVRHKEHPEKWYCNAAACKEENSEAFAGQHAKQSTSFYIFDEASAIPERIWEVAEGGLTDGEPMMFAFGNPTRSSGKFYRIVFGSERHRWRHRSIDSRTSKLTNKEQIGEWLEDHGEDSDFFRVRVRGLPPRASDLQFIDADRIYEAQKRPAVYLPDEPLVAALDVARGGLDNNVIRFRRGGDARSIKAIKIPGEDSRDSMRLVSACAEVLTTSYDGVKVSHFFVDATGIGGPIADRLRQLGYKNVSDVQFGAKAPEMRYANMRAYIWARMKDWLGKSGAIDSDTELEIGLTAPGYKHDKQDHLLLESKEDMKKRGLASPDDADALAMTFARHVAPLTPPRRPAGPPVHISPWS